MWKDGLQRDRRYSAPSDQQSQVQGCEGLLEAGLGGSPDGHLIEHRELGKVRVHEADGLQKAAVLGSSHCSQVGLWKETKAVSGSPPSPFLVPGPERGALSPGASTHESQQLQHWGHLTQMLELMSSHWGQSHKKRSRHVSASELRGLAEARGLCSAVLP